MDTKKKIMILAVCVVVVILAICGIVGIAKNKENENDQDSQQDNQTYYESNLAEFTSVKKPLVIFFTWDGHTEQLAKSIAMKTSADSVIIDVEDEYPIEYEECYHVAEAQKAENTRPKLKDLGVNIVEYDNIFIGYPIWLEDMPMPIYTLLESNDFSGKTVIPFTTSQSSGESGTFEKIRGILSSANVLEGIHISEEAINNNTFEEEVNSWIQGLNLGF